MRTPLAFLRFVAKAALNAVGFGVAGDFAVELLPEMVRDVWDWWGKDHPAAELRAEVQAVAQVGDAEARQLAAAAIAQEAAGQPAPVLEAVAAYLSRVPAAVRASQRRPADPTGRTVSPALMLSRPEHLAPLLPQGPSRFQAGQQVPGFADWTLEELLGVGGFGEVWKAVNPPLPPVAVKFCLDSAAVRTLQNEKALLGRVKAEGTHPGIVRLENTSLLGNPPCLMYEYVAGGDLTRLLHEWHGSSRPNLAGEVARLMRQLAGIVAFAHQLKPQPIVHRDLKPANILLHPTAQGSVQLRVADFGIGGVAARQATEQTRRGSTRGAFLATALRGSHTPLYASPEQMRGDDPDPRDDVHALGVIWYQLLTGDLGSGLVGDWREELSERGVPPGHVDLLGRCIASLKRRPTDAGVLVAELDRLLTGAVAVTATVPPPVRQPETAAEDWVGQAVRTRQKHAQSLEQARKLLAQHDYARALQVLEELPEHARDEALLATARQRRDRVVPLQQEVRAAAQAGRLDVALAFKVQALLELTPNDQALLRLQAALPGVERQIVNSIGMKLVLIPPGTFQMGSPAGEEGRYNDEGPQHVVEITRPFYLGIHPVTQGQWRAVMGSNPSYFCASGDGKDSVKGMNTDDFPIEQVSWEDAQTFLDKLSALQQEGETRRKYRLPSEGEWEFACRGGASEYQVFHFGNSLSSTLANFDGSRPYGGAVAGPYLQRTCKVGSYPANALGLHDMHGNVWEWCLDWYDEAYYGKSPPKDPAGPAEGSYRVIRGGGWHDGGRYCRSADRRGSTPGDRLRALGFRAALALDGGRCPRDRTDRSPVLLSS